MSAGVLRTAVALALVSCSAAMPRFPQIEQAREATESGRERYRAHSACAAATTDADGLVRCMGEAGWNFVTRGPAYPEAECWRARDLGEAERLLDHCFVHKPGHTASGR